MSIVEYIRNSAPSRCRYSTDLPFLQAVESSRTSQRHLTIQRCTPEPEGRDPDLRGPPYTPPPKTTAPVTLKACAHCRGISSTPEWSPEGPPFSSTRKP